MRILVLGAGLQGSACTYDLLMEEDVEAVTLADLKPESAASFVPDSEKLTRVTADFGDDDAMRALMAGHDIVLSAAPYYFNAALAAAAIDAGCQFSDLGGNTGIVREQIAMSDRAERAGVTIVPDVGLAPGLVNVLAAEGVRRFDRPRRVRMYVGGLPRHPKPPLDYQVVYSLEGVLDYYTTPSFVLENGETHEVEALSELETVEFDELGELEAFHTAGGASLQPWELADRVESLSYKTLRYPGHAAIMRAIRDLGLLGEDPVRVGNVDVAPRDVFIACAGPVLRKPDEPDLVALRVVVEGDRDGAPGTLTFDVLDYADETTGISAMERTTGFTLAIVGLFLGRGVIATRGTLPSYRAIPYEPYVEALAARGIEVTERA